MCDCLKTFLADIRKLRMNLHADGEHRKRLLSLWRLPPLQAGSEEALQKSDLYHCLAAMWPARPEVRDLRLHLYPDPHPQPGIAHSARLPKTQQGQQQWCRLLPTHPRQMTFRKQPRGWL